MNTIIKVVASMGIASLASYGLYSLLTGEETRSSAMPPVTAPLFVPSNPTFSTENKGTPILVAPVTPVTPLTHAPKERHIDSLPSRNAPAITEELQQQTALIMSDPEKKATLDRVQHKLKALSQHPDKTDPQEAAAAIEELASLADENGYLAGVNVRQLSQSIRASADLHTLSKEIEAYANGGGTDPKVLTAYIEEVQVLQASITAPDMKTD